VTANNSSPLPTNSTHLKPAKAHMETWELGLIIAFPGSVLLLALWGVFVGNYNCCRSRKNSRRT
jgi:hypothetical protein